MSSETIHSKDCNEPKNIDIFNLDDGKSVLHYGVNNREFDRFEIRAGYPFTIPARSYIYLKTSVVLYGHGEFLGVDIRVFRRENLEYDHNDKLKWTKHLCGHGNSIDFSTIKLDNISDLEISYEKDQIILIIDAIFMPKEWISNEPAWGS